MLVTIVLDAYKESEKSAIAKAIEGLTYYSCWSSAGLYCFWDYYSKEILYLGLSNDLLQRFKQHNGLIKCDLKACKRKELNDYFQNKQKIGFTIMLQSSLFQQLSKKHIKRHRIRLNVPGVDYSNTLESWAFEDIRLMEGASIEVASLKKGILPKWNKMKGSSKAKYGIQTDHYKLIKLLCNSEFNNNVSRATIRELDNNGEYKILECFLHGLRMSPFPWQETLSFYKKLNIGFADLLFASNYLRKKLVI